MSARPSYPPRRSQWVGPGQVPRPVVALDIDGTIGVYHGHFLNFAEDWLGKEMPPTYEYAGGSLHSFMGISKTTYRKVKLAYRQGGLKRSMPAYPGARELTVDLRKCGVELWICTTRPYLALSNIEPDTREFLRRNGVQYDAVIYGEHKYRQLVAHVGMGRVVGVLDDLPEMYAQAAQLGLAPLLRDQPYNRSVRPAYRVHDLHEARKALLERVEDYEEKQRD